MFLLYKYFVGWLYIYLHICIYVCMFVSLLFFIQLNMHSKQSSQLPPYAAYAHLIPVRISSQSNCLTTNRKPKFQVGWHMSGSLPKMAETFKMGRPLFSLEGKQIQNIQILKFHGPDCFSKFAQIS